MSFLTLWLLVFILEKSIATKNRNVNLALETVLLFDKADDLNLITKVQDVLSQIQVLLKNKRQVTDNVTARRSKNYKFIDFVEDVIKTIKSFEDNDLKEVFRIVDRDFRTRKVDNDLIDDNVRRFLTRKLTEIRNQPASNIRSGLDTILRELRSDGNNKNRFILDFVSTLFKNNSERKLKKLIKRLNLFRNSSRKSKGVLKAIIVKIVNDVLYEPYNNLKDNGKSYIKKVVKAYLLDEAPTTKKLKIIQPSKIAEITQESINTDEKIDGSIPTEQMTAFELTRKTFKDIWKETTKKIFTHITLYPKTIKVERIPKFRTGLPTIGNTPADEDNNEYTMDKRYNEDTKEIKEMFTNHSVEINVNLMLKHSKDSQDQDDTQIVEALSTKSTPNKVLLRALKKKSKRKENNHKPSTPALSIETFGSLYKIKTPKKYHNKKISGLNTYNGKATIKGRYFKSSHVDDVIKETNVRKVHLVGDYRRVNKPINLHEDEVTESYTREAVTTTTQHSFTTSALIPLVISTHKIATPVLTTDKSTAKTTQSDVPSEIFYNENVTESKEVIENIPLLNKTSIHSEFTKKDTTMQFENESIDINNKTTIRDVSEVAFDVNKFLKNSESLNFNDDARKKQIAENMQADLNILLDSPSKNATTEGFTDIFKDLEDAFQI